jgi:hypothetical protein
MDTRDTCSDALNLSFQESVAEMIHKNECVRESYLQKSHLRPREAIRLVTISRLVGSDCDCSRLTANPSIMRYGKGCRQSVLATSAACPLYQYDRQNPSNDRSYNESRLIIITGWVQEP